MNWLATNLEPVPSYLHAGRTIIRKGNHIFNMKSLCCHYELIFEKLVKRQASSAKIHIFRDGPLIFIGGGLPFLRLADNFFQRVMHFKQFFSLHFVMKTIFYDHFQKHYRLFLKILKVSSE